MAKTMLAVFSSVLLVSVLLMGCQTSDALRQPGRNDAGMTSERLTYRQYLSPSQNPVHQPQNKVGLFEFVNPFKSRSWSNRIDNNAPPLSDTTNFTPNTRKSDVLPSHSLGTTQLLRADDPPEMIEFAAMLNETDRFSVEQKAELLELLRHESPAMRGSIIANYRVAIRRSDNNGETESHRSSLQNPIVQASYQTSDFMGEYRTLNPGYQDPKSETSVPPIRFADYTMEGMTPINAGLYHASDATENSQGMIRQVADQSVRNGASIRIVRPPVSDTGAIPQIDTNPTLPIVAAPDDFTPLRNIDSSDAGSDVSSSEPDTLTDAREVLPMRQSQAPMPPLASVQEFNSSPNAGNRLGHRVGGANGTMMAIVDSGPGSRIPQIMPLLPTEDDEEYEEYKEYEDYDIPNITQGARVMVNQGLDDHHPVMMDTQRDRDNNEIAYSPDLRTGLQTRTLPVPFPEDSRNQESWSETARRALNLLNIQIANSNSLEYKEQLQDEINQRLMSLTLGNQRDAVQPIDGLPKDLQEFWRNTFIALSTMLDDVSFTDASYRFDAAHSHLQTANSYLQTLCSVRIRKLSFINQCDGFGVYETAPNEFQRGEPVFIYAEIDNLTCRENDGGYLTQVGSSYEIIDVLGNKVVTGEFGKTGKNTQSRIRDVFMLWRVDLPENIMPGKYFIVLSVIDTNHQDSLFDRQRLELNVLSPLGNR